MSPECRGCVYFYEEKDVNYQTCKHPNYGQEEDVCPGRYDKEDAKADAKEAYKDSLQEAHFDNGGGYRYA